MSYANYFKSKQGNISEEATTLYQENLLLAQQRIQELEESLRTETINSEEQRAYIELLKESLEAKLEMTGLGNFVRDLANQISVNHLDLFAHCLSLKQVVSLYHKLQCNCYVVNYFEGRRENEDGGGCQQIPI